MYAFPCQEKKIRVTQYIHIFNIFLRDEGGFNIFTHREEEGAEKHGCTLDTQIFLFSCGIMRACAIRSGRAVPTICRYGIILHVVMICSLYSINSLFSSHQRLLEELQRQNPLSSNSALLQPKLQHLLPIFHH